MAISWHLTEEEVEHNDLPYSTRDRELIEEHRWMAEWSGVFTDTDGNDWRIEFALPLTETQEDDPWIYGDPIAVRVEKKQVIVEKWVEVEE